MALRIASQLGLTILHEAPVGLLAPLANSNANLQFARHGSTKHWLPKWKQLRRAKVVKIDLPNYQEKEEDLTEEQIRSKMKEKGLLPPRPWAEQQYYVSTTGGVFEPYVPPEGDGKISPISTQGAKQKLQYLEKKSKTMMAIRKIRAFEEDFDTQKFCLQAEEVYKKAHECMAANDKDNICRYVTERAYPEIIHNVENKTIHWKYIKSVELPRIVHARWTNVIAKENIFAQVTVRFHTQQQLAIYDRFGRLMHGSEILAKDVLEYVVFEKHVANEYGTWRIHDKIIPDWMPPKEPAATTYKVQPAVEEEEEEAVSRAVVEEEVAPVTTEQTKPSLVTA